MDLVKKSRVAARMERLRGEGAIETLTRALELEQAGRDIIHLEIGEPDYDTPKNVKAACVRSLEAGHTHYGPPAGIPELREAIAGYLRASRGIDAHPKRIIVTPGGKPVIFYTILTLVEDGDEVIYPNPGFPAYETTIAWAGGTPVPLPLEETSGFRFEVEALRARISSRTKLLILNSPANPTGGVLTKADLDAVAALARQHDFYILSDEIYSQMVYERGHHSIAALPDMRDRIIVLDGFSKSFAMTGWRLGFGHFPEEMIPHVLHLIINSWSCLQPFIQHAGIEALTGPRGEVEAMLASFKERRDFVVKRLNQIPGLHCVRPAGAFYAFPNITETGMTSRECSQYLLDNANVALLPGTDFGEFGEGYLRLSFANSMERLEQALDRMEAAIRRR